MTARLFTVTFLLFLTTAIRSAGQEIVHLGVDKGLSNGYVTAIAEDGNNNIWVATEEGLNRWDGKRFHKYMPGNSALTDPELSSLICLEDDKDHVWVGSQRNGIFCVDLQGYKISKVDRGFRTRDIAALTPGRNSGMWITHYHFGPQFYDPVRDVLHPSVSGRTPGLPTLSWTTYEAADGRLYIGHVDQGLSVVDTLTHTFRNYRYPELPGNTVYAITGYELGNIWIGTDHGAAFFNPTTGEIKKIEHDHCNPASIRPGNVRSIVAGDNGTLWFATSQGGVSVLNIKEVMTNGIDSARFTSLPYNNAPGGTAGSFIRCILRDSYGNMWIGNYNRGVDFHSHKPSIITRVNYFKENRRERYLPVMSASATRDGSVWIGSDPDMALISSKGEVLRRVPLTYDGKRLTSYVRCVYADEECGRVWAGTNEEGLYIYCPADGSVAKVDMPLTNMRSVKVFGDSMYVSTDVGVYSISRQGTQAVPCTAFNDSLEDKIVNDFEIDRRGLYWVATFGKGLYVMTRKRLAAYLMSRSEGRVISDDETVTPDEEEKKIVEQSLSPLDAHFLEKLNNILSDNIADDALNVTLLADKMCMSNSTLYRKLMSLLGVSPNEYIRRLRLKHATELLHKRELSIEEITFRTGFGSYNTFSKVFKKEFGLSPTEYIKKNIVKQTGG